MFLIDESASKPALNNDLLMHYGIRGMHWGVRRGKKSTGVSRARGVLLDRNARDMKMLKDARAGKGHLLPRGAAKLGKKMLGEKLWEKNYQKHMSEVMKQNKRLKSGKLTVADKLDMSVHLYRFGGVGLLVSHKPK